MNVNKKILFFFVSFFSFLLSKNLILHDYDAPSQNQANHTLDATIQDDLLIVVGMLGGIDFYDISIPSELNHLDNLQLSSSGGGGQGGGTKPNCMVTSGNYAYVTTNRGLGVINISNPSNPQYLGIVNGTNDYILENLDIYGSVLAVAAHEDGVLIYDLSTPSNPQFDYVIPSDNSWVVSLDENYIYVGDQSNLVKYSYSNTEALNTLELSNSIKDIYIGEYIYIAIGSDGVSAVDKTTFSLINTYNTSALANRIDVSNVNSNEIIAVSDWDDVEILNMVNQELQLVGFKNTTRRTMAIATKNDYVYSAEWNSVQIFEYGEIDGPDLDLDLYELNYPYVQFGESYNLSLEVTNNGNQILNIVDAYTTNNEFSYSELNDLNPGETQIVDIVYTANSDNASGSYRIFSNDQDESEIVCETNGNINGANIGDIAPDFNLNIIANGSGAFQLSDYIDKVVVLAFFAPN